MLYRIAAVVLASTLLIACGDESPFSDFSATSTSTTTGGGGGGVDGENYVPIAGGGNGAPTTDFSNITLLTHIPAEVPNGAGGTLLAGFESFDMGNEVDSISYVLKDSTDAQRVFRDGAVGAVELYSRPSPELVFTVTSGSGNKILSHNGVRDVIDYTTGNTLAIGAAAGAVTFKTITDAGDVVAFPSRNDLAGANPTGVNQIFTLSTDGSEMYNQITTFTADNIIEDVVISGDGSRIFFSSTSDVMGDGSNADGSYEIFSINTNSTGLEQLSDFNSSRVHTTHSSSDGSVITLEIIDLGGLTGKWLYTLNTTSSVFSEIAVTSGAGFSIDYDLSADGSKVTYLGVNLSDNLVIYVLNSDGSGRTEALIQRGSMRGLQINTNGSQVAFHSSIDFGIPIAPNESTEQVYGVAVP